MVVSWVSNGYRYTSMDAFPFEVTNIKDWAGSAASQNAIESTFDPEPSTLNAISAWLMLRVLKGSGSRGAAGKGVIGGGLAAGAQPERKTIATAWRAGRLISPRTIICLFSNRSETSELFWFRRSSRVILVSDQPVALYDSLAIKRLSK